MAFIRGGVYLTRDGGRAMEHQASYQQAVFGFFGITGISFVRAEGLAMSDAPKVNAIAAAETYIKALTTEAVNEASVVKVA